MTQKTLELRRLKQAEVYDRIETGNRGKRNQLIRKQVSGQEHWLRVWAGIDPTREDLQAHAKKLVERALVEVEWANRKYSSWGRAVYGWSGGKDSLALEIVMEAAGIHDCCFVITDLEWPRFLQWATDRMPDGCTVVHRRNVNLAWLRNHPELLFPPDAAASAKWFSAVQHAGQASYITENGGPLMFLGRRKMDGNMTGEDGYTSSKRGRFYNPIRDWTHEDVLVVLRVYGVEMPPIYMWPRGFQVGTGPWPARQFCRSVDSGWTECWQIDESVVRQAAEALPSAQEWMASRGLQ